MSTVKKGELAESKFISRCLEKGYNVSKPFGYAVRYDLIVERDTGLYRVQVKHSRPALEGDVLIFNVCSTNNVTKENKTYTKENVDAIGVYSPSQKRTYWIPIADIPTREMRLRVSDTNNDQTSRSNWAENYQF